MRALSLSIAVLLTASIVFAGYDECSLQSDVEGPPPGFPTGTILVPGSSTVLFADNGPDVFLYDSITALPVPIATIPHNPYGNDYDPAAMAADDSALYIATLTRWPDTGLDSPFGKIYRVTTAGDVSVVADQLFPVSKMVVAGDTLWYVAGGTLRKQSKTGGTAEDIALDVTSLFIDGDTILFVIQKRDLWALSSTGEFLKIDDDPALGSKEDIAATSDDYYVIVEGPPFSTFPGTRKMYRKSKMGGPWREVLFDGGEYESFYAPLYLFIADGQIFAKVGTSCSRGACGAFLTTVRHDQFFIIWPHDSAQDVVAYGDFAGSTCAIYTSYILGHYTFALRPLRLLPLTRSIPESGRIETIELMGEHGVVSKVTIDGVDAPIISQNSNDVTIFAPPHPATVFGVTLVIHTVDGKSASEKVGYGAPRRRAIRH